jgi:hypothetical protein
MSSLGLSTCWHHLARDIFHSFVSMRCLAGLSLGWSKSVAEPLADLVCHSLLMLLVYFSALLHKEDAGPGFFYIMLASCGLLE